MRSLDLGDGVHAYLTTAEIDALKERKVYYLQTTCLIYRDDGEFVVAIEGHARKEDLHVRADFEKTCASARLLPVITARER